MAKSRVDAETRSFYLEEKWRSWRFRIYYRRKGSEDKLLNRMEETFGPSGVLFCGDWLSNKQQKGCTPSPNVGMRLLLKKKVLVARGWWIQDLRVQHVYEWPKKFRKRNGRPSYSKLSCPTCSDQLGARYLWTRMKMQQETYCWQAHLPSDRKSSHIATV